MWKGLPIFSGENAGGGIGIKMTKRIAIAAVIVIAVVSVTAALVSSTSDSGSAPVMLGSVEKQSFDVKITETGVLESLRSVTLSSEIPSNNAKLVYIVPEGTQVEKGDVVIRFDATPFMEDCRKYQFQANEARAALQEATEEVELDKVRAEKERQAAQHAVRLAELQLENVLKGEGPISLEDARSKTVQAKAQSEQTAGHLADLEELQKEGFVNDEEVRKARNSADEAKASYSLANLRYETMCTYIYPALQEKAKAELAKARNEASQLELTLKHQAAKTKAAFQRAQAILAAAEERLRSAEDQLGKTIVRAPIPGFVVYRESHLSGEKRKPRIGDSFWCNQPIVELPDVTAMVVQSKVREVDIHKLKMGQEVQVTVHAYPDPVHTGAVDMIGTLASADPDTKSMAKYFHLRVVLSGEDSRLRPGMTVRIDVMVERVQEKLTVPASAIFREGSKSFCYRWNGKRAEKLEVQTGLSDNMSVIIEGGLRNGDRVCLSQPADGLVAVGASE